METTLLTEQEKETLAKEAEPCNPEDCNGCEEFECQNNAQNKTSGLTFGQALEYLKGGARVKRAVWKGQGWVLNQITNPLGLIGYEEKPMIYAYTAHNTIAPAQAYQEDMLAEDWQIV